MATKKVAAKKMVVKKAAAKKAVATADPVEAKASSKAVPAKMTKLQSIRYMAERLEVAPKQVTAFFDLLIETATTQTREAGEFTIPGLGKLVKAQRAARIGRNPATGEAIQIEAKTTVKFRLAKAAKDAIISPRE